MTKQEQQKVLMVLNLKEHCLEDWKCGEEKMDWDNLH